MNAYDNWKTSPPEPKEVGVCAECSLELYEGEEVYLVEDTEDLIHLTCLKEYAANHIDVRRITVTAPTKEDHDDN